MNCPYCFKEAEWVENKAVYGKNYGKSVMMYLCRSCDAYVGCHQNTRKALGTMANRELREWRVKAHASFDPFWRTTIRWDHPKQKIRREKAYGLLKRHFGMDIHIGEADVEMCKNIIKAVVLLKVKPQGEGGK